MLMLWMLAGMVSWAMILWNEYPQPSVNGFMSLLIAITMGPILLLLLITLMIHAKVSR